MAPDAQDSYEVTAKTKVQRLKARAKYDRETVHSILDEAFLAHVGFIKNDFPLVLPMGYARVGEKLYLHGSITNAMLKTLKAEVDLCVTVTLLDAIVVARSTFHHSMNYRSVVALGKAVAVTDPEEKAFALDAITEHILPGRTKEVRKTTQSEFNSTLVLALELREVSAKVRVGPPKDLERDYQLPDIWAGVLPIAPLRALPPVDDERLLPGIAPPPSVTDYKRPARAAWRE